MLPRGMYNDPENPPGDKLDSKQCGTRVSKVSSEINGRTGSESEKGEETPPQPPARSAQTR